jgi:hypothetical protein
LTQCAGARISDRPELLQICRLPPKSFSRGALPIEHGDELARYSKAFRPKRPMAALEAPITVI